MLEKAIAWMYSKKGKVTYSMAFRNGTNPDGGSSYDCSSSIYYALKDAGNFPSTMRIGNTDSLFSDLEHHGWTRVPEDANGNIDARRGDIFIWGARGASGGAAGHTGMFVNAADIINCNYGYNGMVVNNHDWLYGINGSPANTIYRYTGNTTPQPASNLATDQVVEVGSFVKFDGAYTANDVQLIENTWQVRTNQLCEYDFAWEDNGIPAAVLTEVDESGYATADQELAIGSKYKIPGKFLVLDIGEYKGNWMAQVGAGAMTFWVDIETATEVGSGDAGTPVPSNRPNPVVVPPSSPPPPPVVQPVTPPVTTPTNPNPQTPPPVVEPPKATPTEDVELRGGLVALFAAIGEAIKSFIAKFKK
jgi:hypothetical protein